MTLTPQQRVHLVAQVEKIICIDDLIDDIVDAVVDLVIMQKPEDVFDEDTLIDWAERNGWKPED